MRDAELIKTFNRRAVIAFGGELFLFSVLAARLYKLQILDNDKYTKLSDKNSIRIKLITPSRGVILDRFGKELAININNYSIYMIPEELKARGYTIDDIVNKISSLIKFTDKDRKKFIKNLKGKRDFFPIAIKNNLTWDEMSIIQTKNLEFPGVYIEEGKLRFYPNNEIAAHLLGYVSNVTENELKKDSSPILQLSEFKTGKSGIEKYMELELRGNVGKSVQVINSTGRVINDLDDKSIKPVSGKNVYLTIDTRLQEYAYNIIKDESASAVIMDIYTGEVLMMISVPSYNPNIFLNDTLSNSDFENLFNNIRHPFINKAIEGLYAPGSTFKPITALAALSDGKITNKTKILCSGHFDFAGSRYHCWQESGHGYLNLEQAISHSCDIYFYDIATKINMDLIQDMAFKFGLGSLTGIELPREQKGIVPSKSWKQNFKSESWYTGDTITAAIGQSFTLTTPLQLAVMTARIANGGLEVFPRILKNSIDINIIPPSLNINHVYLDYIKKGMFSVVSRGTGKTAYFDYKGNKMAGKTGTTQVKRITKEERLHGVKRQEDLPWHHRNHALFVGYAPYKNPRFAVSVVVEHGISGSTAAAPIARDLMRKTLELYL